MLTSLETIPDCEFCKIANGAIPTRFVKITDNFVVFADINPTATVDLLIVPIKHFATITEMPEWMWVEARDLGQEIAVEQGLRGYRLVANYGTTAVIKHAKIHLQSGVTKNVEI
jgi:histidine triad (HIT) family protein